MTQGSYGTPGRRAVADLEQLRRWSRLLDEAFLIPFLNVRVGLDPILGLIPFLGDLVTPLFTLSLLVHAARVRVPRVVQFRMLLNVLIDAGTGMLPIAGDLFDFAWKANTRNLTLLERHARPGSQPSLGDWLFVAAAVALVIAIAAIPVLLMMLLWFTLRAAR